MDSKKSKIVFAPSRLWWTIIAVVILAFVVLPSYYFYSQYQKSQALLNNPSQASTAEAQALVNSVGKLIQLPDNENPTIATVSDKTKLQNQPLFARAENGDKVLVYSQSRMLILYRPSLNKIIAVGTVNAVSAAPATPIPAVTPVPFLSPSPSATPFATFTPTAPPVQ